MQHIIAILRRLTRNNAAFLIHRGIMRSIYGNRVQRLVNRDMFNRPEWFWAQRACPNLELSRPKSTDGLNPEQKRALVADLLESFHQAQRLDPENRNYSDLWATIIGLNARQVVQALVSRDAERLLEFLENMFPNPALWGIGYGDLGVSQGSRYASFLILHQLVGFAESIGVTRTECPEQGDLGHALSEGPECLLDAIERRIGIRLDFPRIGGAYGIDVAGRLLDMQTPGHAYTAYRLKTHIARYCPAAAPSILEIGAGFGGAAFWFLHQVPAAKYTILDLALTNVYQGWFLANSLGRENVSLFCDIMRSGRTGHSKVSILPTNAERYLGEERFTAAFNQDSLPEMPESNVDGYLRLIHARLDGVFFSCNQEAYSPIGGAPPPWVADRVSKLGGFERIARDLSWVRRGYVEEIYRTSA